MLTTSGFLSPVSEYIIFFIPNAGTQTIFLAAWIFPDSETGSYPVAAQLVNQFVYFNT